MCFKYEFRLKHTQQLTRKGPTFQFNLNKEGSWQWLAVWLHPASREKDGLRDVSIQGNFYIPKMHTLKLRSRGIQEVSSSLAWGSSTD